MNKAPLSEIQTANMPRSPLHTFYLDEDGEHNAKLYTGEAPYSFAPRDDSNKRGQTATRQETYPLRRSPKSLFFVTDKKPNRAPYSTNSTNQNENQGNQIDTAASMSTSAPF